MSTNSVNTTYSIYSDWDLARLFQNLPMPAADKQTFVADYSALKQNQIDTKGSILALNNRVAVAEGRITDAELRIADAELRLDDAEVRLDNIEAELIVINQRIDAVEAVAYMAAIT
jgi:hypothetical protein